MAPPELAKLYAELVASKFNFMRSGEHPLKEVHRVVRGRFPQLCDDGVRCDQICRKGSGPEWQHRVRAALQTLKSSSGPTGVSVPIGINGTKLHQFDLGDPDRKVLVECKAHTWTESYNIPSAKITTWNQAMYYFYAAPSGYRKILFVLRHLCERRNETLGQYYIRINSHLIPADVEIWEFDEVRDTAERIR